MAGGKRSHAAADAMSPCTKRVARGLSARQTRIEYAKHLEAEEGELDKEARRTRSACTANKCKLMVDAFISTWNLQRLVQLVAHVAAVHAGVVPSSGMGPSVHSNGQEQPAVYDTHYPLVKKRMGRVIAGIRMPGFVKANVDHRILLSRSMACKQCEQDKDLSKLMTEDNAKPKLLARFKVNTMDTLAEFKAVSKEDFKDVIGLLPENTPLPASDKMTYLLARLEVNSQRDLPAALQRVGAGQMSMNEAVGPAVGCLMATFGTNMISSCIFVFEDPDDLRQVLYDVEERIELWGLQIPHNSVRPPLEESTEGAAAAEDGQAAKDSGSVITWTSVDRLNMSIGLLYALCNHALDSGIKCGFCVPRPQLLKRWLQAGVKMRQIPTDTLKLIYPPSAHDYEYYKASTVAYFMITEVRYLV
ncbi:kinesin-like protein, partial [Haematococcus lacustris]